MSATSEVGESGWSRMAAAPLAEMCKRVPSFPVLVRGCYTGRTLPRTPNALQTHVSSLRAVHPIRAHHDTSSCIVQSLRKVCSPTQQSPYNCAQHFSLQRNHIKAIWTFYISGEAENRKTWVMMSANPVAVVATLALSFETTLCHGAPKPPF